MIPMRHFFVARPAVAGAILLATLSPGAGCALPLQWQNPADKLPQATLQDPANHILCIWEAAEGMDPDGKPTRGFAGKLTFFNRGERMGVRIKGDVRITVYDDQGKPEDRGKPLHNWDFLGKAWEIHLQDSDLGAAYSVFIPYSRKGNHRAQCALQVKFTPENGTPIYSDTVAVLLDGPIGKKDEEAAKAKSRTDKRTALDSITIPLKEKRTTGLERLPNGRVELEQVEGPVSELNAKHPFQARGQFTPLGSSLLGKTSPAMSTLPSAPRSVTSSVMPPPVETPSVIPPPKVTHPVISSHLATPAGSPPRTLPTDPAAQPISTAKPSVPATLPATSPYLRSANPLSSQQHPSLGNGS